LRSEASQREVRTPAIFDTCGQAITVRAVSCTSLHPRSDRSVSPSTLTLERREPQIARSNPRFIEEHEKPFKLPWFTKIMILVAVVGFGTVGTLLLSAFFSGKEGVIKNRSAMWGGFLGGVLRDKLDRTVLIRVG